MQTIANISPQFQAVSEVSSMEALENSMLLLVLVGF